MRLQPWANCMVIVWDLMWSTWPLFVTGTEGDTEALPTGCWHSQKLPDRHSHWWLQDTCIFYTWCKITLQLLFWSMHIVTCNNFGKPRPNFQWGMLVQVAPVSTLFCIRYWHDVHQELLVSTSSDQLITYSRRIKRACANLASPFGFIFNTLWAFSIWLALASPFSGFACHWLAWSICFLNL